MAPFIKCGLATKVAATTQRSRPSATKSRNSACAGRLCCVVAATLVAKQAFAANESLLSAPDAPPYKWFASTDPKHENEDYLLLKPGETRKIPLASGRLERLWWTALEPEKIETRLLSDDLGTPWLLARNGKIQSVGPFVYNHISIHQKAFLLLPPEEDPAEIEKRSEYKHGQFAPTDTLSGNSPQLAVTNVSKDENKFFYQITIRPNPPAWTAPLPKPLSESLSNLLAPGAEKVIDLKGVGQIKTLELTLQKPDDVKSLRMRAAWDGAAANAIDAPVSALLSLFDGGKKAQSAGFDFDGKIAVLKWPMPFSKGAKITFVNTGSAPVAFESKIRSFQLKTAPPYRFHAVYGATRTQLKTPVRMLDVTGKGAFCGLNLSIVPAPDSRRRTFAYLEGNETITADGEAFEGTGTEDFFSSAWYFPKQPFSFPYHGMTFKSEMPPGVSAYRLMIPDAVPFKKSLRFDFEHGKSNNSDDLIYRWVAFWYAEPKAEFKVLDAIGENASATAAPNGQSGQATLILTALISAFIVGVGGAWWLKRARK